MLCICNSNISTTYCLSFAVIKECACTVCTTVAVLNNNFVNTVNMVNSLMFVRVWGNFTTGLLYITK